MNSNPLYPVINQVNQVINLSDYIEEGTPYNEEGTGNCNCYNQNQNLNSNSIHSEEGVINVENEMLNNIDENIQPEGIPQNTLCNKIITKFNSLKNKCNELSRCIRQCCINLGNLLCRFLFKCYLCCIDAWKPENCQTTLAIILFMAFIIGLLFIFITSPFYIIILKYKVDPTIDHLNGERKCCAYQCLKTLFDYAWVTQKGTASYDFYYLGKPTNERRRFQALAYTTKNINNIPNEFKYCITDNFIYCQGAEYTKQLQLSKLYNLQNYMYVTYFLLGIVCSLVYLLAICAGIAKLLFCIFDTEQPPAPQN
jgi:hypothetical protein